MSSLILSFNVTAPIFIMMGAGYLMKMFKLIDDKFIAQISALNFRVFLPFSIFKGMYTADISQIWNGKAMLYVVISVALIFLFGTLISFRLTPDHAKRGTMISIILRSNYSYVGLPIVASICGQTANISVLVLVATVVTNNIFATIGFEMCRGGKPDFKTLLLKVIKNPCIIASVISIIFMLMDVEQFPDFIHNPISMIGSMCTPVGLFALGGALNLKKIGGNLRLIAWGSALRLVIVPLIFVTGAVFLGFRGDTLAALFILYATPPATLTFTLSQTMGGDPELASEQIVVQSVLSMLTLFLWVFVLSYFGLF